MLSVVGSSRDVFDAGELGKGAKSFNLLFALDEATRGRGAVWGLEGRGRQPQKGRCVYSGTLPPFSTQQLELDVLCLAANPGTLDLCASGSSIEHLERDLPDGSVGSY